jgi:hypothetical protein
MEVIDIISHYIDKTQNLIIVEFRMLGDDDETVREDFIEYSFFEDFGFDNKKDFEIFESIMEDDDDEWGDDDFDYIDNETSLISFLNEYYVVYPKKIPKSEFK